MIDFADVFTKHRDDGSRPVPSTGSIKGLRGESGLLGMKMWNMVEQERWAGGKTEDNKARLRKGIIYFQEFQLFIIINHYLHHHQTTLEFASRYAIYAPARASPLTYTRPYASVAFSQPVPRGKQAPKAA